jgi:hypothetical protein
MAQRQTGARFRQRKLSTKQNLPVLREHEVEKLVDDDASRHIPKVETGVEKGEEIVSPFPSAPSPFRHISPFSFTGCTNDQEASILPAFKLSLFIFMLASHVIYLH